MKINEYFFKSEKIIYDKNKEIIFSKDKTKIFLMIYII